MPLVDLPPAFHTVGGSDRGFFVSLLSRLLPFHLALPPLALVHLPPPFWYKQLCTLPFHLIFRQALLKWCMQPLNDFLSLLRNRGKIHRFHQAIIIFLTDNDGISYFCANVHRFVILNCLL